VGGSAWGGDRRQTPAHQSGPPSRFAVETCRPARCLRGHALLVRVPGLRRAIGRPKPTETREQGTAPWMMMMMMMCSAAVRRQPSHHQRLSIRGMDATQQGSTSMGSPACRCWIDRAETRCPPRHRPLSHVPGALAAGETGRPPAIPGKHPLPGQPRMPQRHAVFWNNCEALPGFGEQGKSRKQEHGFFVILISRRSRPHLSR